MHKRLAAIAAIFAISSLPADEKLAGIACRSVHLGYPAGEGTAFYNEVAVEKSAEGTYFCVCGFNKGYFGIQEKSGGKKVVIFSVWDPGKQNDQKSVADDQRVKCLHQGDGVEVKRFGGEGTGGQSFFQYDWKPNTTYRFLVTCQPDGERSAFAGYFYLPESKQWKHLVTFSTLATKKRLGGYYSFVEDFQRNRVSLTRPRRANFGNGWVREVGGTWKPLNQARFTADGNPATNIDAGLIDDWFYLATGGNTENKAAKLKETIDRPASGKPPADLPIN